MQILPGGATPADARARTALSWARTDVPPAGPADLRRHALALLCGWVVIAVVIVGSDAVVANTREPGDLECSYVPELHCDCDEPRLGFSLATKLVLMSLGSGVTLLSIFWLIYRIMHASLGAPQRPWEARFWIVFASPLYFALTLSVGGYNGAFVFFALAMIVGMLRWRKSAFREAVMCISPFACIALLSMVWAAVFTNHLPDLARDHPDKVALVLVLAEVSEIVFRQIAVRMLARLVRGRWPWPQQSLLVRLVAAMGSAQRLANAYTISAFKGYTLGELTPWHPLMLSQYFFIASQLATRQNALTVARGRIQRLGNSFIKARQSPLSAMYGSSRDLRYGAYVSAALLQALHWDSGVSWFTSCDGEYLDYFHGGSGIFFLLLGVELFTDLLWALSQRALGPESPFQALRVTAPFFDTVLLVVYVTMGTFIGLGLTMAAKAHALGVSPAL